jgi:hypothetical protein
LLRIHSGFWILTSDDLSCYPTSIKIAAIGAGSYVFGRSVLHQTLVELDPTIEDKPAGWRALQECLTVRAGILPRYA